MKTKEQIIKLKKETERKITNLIADFQAQTGLLVKNVIVDSYSAIILDCNAESLKGLGKNNRYLKPIRALEKDMEVVE